MLTLRPWKHFLQTLMIAGFFVCGGATAAMASQTAGTVERLEGEVRISGLSGDRLAGRKSEVNEGEKIATGVGSEAVVRMVDGALLAIRPNSQVLISSYRFSKDPQKAKEDSSIIQLLRGGLRAVTGLIGKQNPAGVQYRTVTATVGIRGTDFELVVLEQDTAEATAGTYNKVFEGQTYLESIDGKRVEVGVNQSAYAPQDVINLARQFGILNKVPNVFLTGKFDDILQVMQQEALKRLQSEFGGQLPIQFQFLLPALGNLLKQDRTIGVGRPAGTSRPEPNSRTDGVGRTDPP